MKRKNILVLGTILLCASCGVDASSSTTPTTSNSIVSDTSSTTSSSVNSVISSENTTTSVSSVSSNSQSSISSEATSSENNQTSQDVSSDVSSDTSSDTSSNEPVESDPIAEAEVAEVMSNYVNLYSSVSLIEQTINDSSKQKLETKTVSLYQKYMTVDGSVTDLSDNSVTNYEQFKGIYNNEYFDVKYYGIESYNSSASRKNVGTGYNDITETDALNSLNDVESLKDIKAKYDDLLTANNKNVIFSKNENGYKVTTYYPSTSYWNKNVQVREFTLIMKDQKIKTANYVSRTYAGSDYDFDNDILNENATETSTANYTYDLTYGTRQDVAVAEKYVPTQYWMTSFTCSVQSSDSSEDNVIYIGNDYNSVPSIKILTYEGQKALNAKDYNLEIKEIEDESLFKKEYYSYYAQKEGTTNIVVWEPETGISYTARVTLKYRDAVSLYVNPITDAKVDSLSEITCRIYPDGAKTDFNVTLSNDNAEVVEKDGKKYLLGKKEGTVVVTCSSVSNPNVKNTMEVTIAKADINTPLIGKWEGSNISAEFNKEGTGSITLNEVTTEFTFTYEEGVYTFDCEKAISVAIAENALTLTFDGNEYELTKVESSSISGTYVYEGQWFDQTFTFNDDGTAVYANGCEYNCTYSINGNTILIENFDENYYDHVQGTIADDGKSMTLVSYNENGADGFIDKFVFNLTIEE